MRQCCYIEEEFCESGFIMCQFIRSKIKFFPLLLGFKKLIIKSFLYVRVYSLRTISVCPFSRRESVNPKLCFPVFAYPPIELLFLNLDTNSSKFIFPLNFGICFRLNFRRTLPYFLTQL